MTLKTPTVGLPLQLTSGFLTFLGSNIFSDQPLCARFPRVDNLHVSLAQPFKPRPQQDRWGLKRYSASVPLAARRLYDQGETGLVNTSPEWMIYNWQRPFTSWDLWSPQRILQVPGVRVLDGASRPPSRVPGYQLMCSLIVLDGRFPRVTGSGLDGIGFRWTIEWETWYFAVLP